MTQRLEMEVRKWRPTSRPSGVIATTLDPSRRLLTRRRSGVKPRPSHAWPVSSQRRNVRCSRRAFFNANPVPLGPDRDHEFVALSRPDGRALHAEAVRLERPLKVAGMIVDPELALDQSSDAPKGPALGGKARREGTPIEEPAQAGPGFLVKPSGRSEVGARYQTARALLGERGSPAADPGAAHPHVPGDVGLREPPLAQQRRSRETALFRLLQCRMGRSPDVAIRCAPPHDDGHRPVLRHLREDH